MTNTEERGNIFEKGFDGLSHLFTRVDHIKNNDDFEEWAKDQKLKGNGNSENPYIIDSSIELPKSTFLSNLDVFLLFESREFNLLDFKKCKNLTIKDCSFNKLTFLKCSNLSIINSKINILNVLKSKDLEFRDCKIATLFDYYSRTIKYTENEIKLDYFKGQKSAQNPWLLFLIGLITVMIATLISLALISPPTIQSPFFLIAAVLAFVLVYLITKTPIGKELQKNKKKKINL